LSLPRTRPGGGYGIVFTNRSAATAALSDSTTTLVDAHTQAPAAGIRAISQRPASTPATRKIPLPRARRAIGSRQQAGLVWFRQQRVLIDHVEPRPIQATQETAK
jgi:hypothetical protein